MIPPPEAVAVMHTKKDRAGGRADGQRAALTDAQRPKVQQEKKKKKPRAGGRGGAERRRHRRGIDWGGGRRGRGQVATQRSRQVSTPI
ncbi:hypothetical protein P280DRAFT_22254 [Massarina eburnea CBS 473.64]|uniref:Uncharacterized protein n=1 Tax=Massarina eburnea CBS 473.64 TaxID=1395130 RepID=A0A6A6RYQ3_9PLEO|nr:hypothetical protein P280DRAFT_22254 [Massarina eburnea CBS 473.64]